MAIKSSNYLNSSKRKYRQIILIGYLQLRLSFEAPRASREPKVSTIRNNSTFWKDNFPLYQSNNASLCNYVWIQSYFFENSITYQLSLDFLFRCVKYFPRSNWTNSFPLLLHFPLFSWKHSTQTKKMFDLLIQFFIQHFLTTDDFWYQSKIKAGTNELCTLCHKSRSYYVRIKSTISSIQ